MDASVVLLRFGGCRLHSNGQKCVYSCFSRETRMDDEMADLVAEHNDGNGLKVKTGVVHRLEFTAYFTDSC